MLTNLKVLFLPNSISKSLNATALSRFQLISNSYNNAFDLMILDNILTPNSLKLTPTSASEVRLQTSSLRKFSSCSIKCLECVSTHLTSFN